MTTKYYWSYCFLIFHNSQVSVGCKLTFLFCLLLVLPDMIDSQMQRLFTVASSVNFANLTLDAGGSLDSLEV